MRAPLLVIAVLVVLLALPAAAQGKGATKATITGPGLDGPVTLAGFDERGGQSKLSRLAELTGFYEAVFGQVPSTLEPRRPAGDLGPVYDVAYVLPGPNGNTVLRQQVYPYAAGGPVTHVAPGQRFFGSQRARGGWYRGDERLRELLTDAGLPQTAPDDGGGGFPVGWAGGGAAALTAALAAALVLVRRRRPPLEPAVR